MNLFWLAGILTAATAEWIAVGMSWVRVRRVTKPLTMILIVTWFSLEGGWQGNLFWFGLGLTVSLAGDILLLLPPRFFLGGLAAFLTAHIFYILGFTGQTAPVIRWEGLLISAVIGLLALRFGRPIAAGARRKSGGKMMIPVIFYLTVISLMVITALLTLFNPAWPALAARTTAAGALLFMLSDTLLGTRQFVRRVRYDSVLIMITYHAGQVLIALGALLAFA